MYPINPPSSLYLYGYIIPFLWIYIKPNVILFTQSAVPLFFPPPKENLNAIEEALKAGGNQNYIIKEIPNLNHLFQTTQTGAPSEYRQIEEIIAPKALDLVGESK